MNIEEIQNEINKNEKYDEYNIYQKFTQGLEYQLSKDEYYGLNLANHRLDGESFDEYKLRRRKIKHYLKIKGNKVFYPSSYLKTYDKGKIDETLYQNFEKYKELING